MNPDQIVGIALVVVCILWLGLAWFFTEEGQITVRKFASEMVDALRRILGIRTRLQFHLSLEARERQFDVEADLLRDAARGNTQAAIDRIDRELNKILWERSTTQGQRAPVLVEAERRFDLCPWGVYHDPELSRCECWDPGQ